MGNGYHGYNAEIPKPLEPKDMLTCWTDRLIPLESYRATDSSAQSVACFPL
ncbi:hypothetical protein I79_017549 [Cricetulus griseus]|uniref:Uncharacterized protein n=1 Tax=Cricetulus griseus TaxID=10029 RepID=G3I2C0_CRIGR|nr:hypothetical protein I79_017549 [Cricetulus griseus]